MKTKTALLLLSSLLLIAALFSCANPASVSQLSDSERAEVLAASLAAMNTAYSEMAPAPLESIAVSPRALYTGSGFIIDGTSDPINITITFNNYTSAGVSINGTVSMQDLPPYNMSSFSSTANITIIYNGETHTLAWNFSISASGSAISFTGTYTVDGSTYSY